MIKNIAMVSIVFLLSATCKAEDMISAISEACLTKKTNWTFCLNLYDKSKEMERLTQIFIADNDLEAPANALIFAGGVVANNGLLINNPVSSSLFRSQIYIGKQVKFSIKWDF